MTVVCYRFSVRRDGAKKQTVLEKENKNDRGIGRVAASSLPKSSLNFFSRPPQFRSSRHPNESLEWATAMAKRPSKRCNFHLSVIIIESRLT